MTELRDVFHQLVRLEIELWDVVEARLRRDHDVSLARFEVLRAVGTRTPTRVNDIAADLAITVGGTSKLVDRLEAAGLCRRLPNPDDRRSSLIELTPAGRRLLQGADRSFADELERRLGAALPARDLTHLLRTLTRLRAALSAPDPEGTRP